MENKRGQGMSTSTIILLILGLVILVVLVLGFSVGWAKIAPWLSSSNIDTIQTGCDSACSMQSEYDFCAMTREIKDGTNDKFETTCYQLATNATLVARGYGIDTCADLCQID